MKITQTFLEYNDPAGETMRVEAGREMLDAYDINGSDGFVFEQVLRWHQALSSQPKAWKVVCRRYGVAPMFGLEDADEARPWSPEKIADRLAMPVSDVNELLVESRSYWLRWRNANATREEVAAKPSAVADGELTDELVDTLLRREGFSGINDIGERRFIARRILETEELLGFDNQRSMVLSLIRQEAALTYVLDASIHACRDEMARTAAKQHSTKEEEKRLLSLMEARNKAQSALHDTMKALGISEEHTDANRRRLSFQNTVSGLVQAIQAYEANGDNALIDGIFKADEVMILTTPFDIRPRQYRPDLPMIAPDCIRCLFDPNFEAPVLLPHAHKRLAMAFDAALSSLGEPVRELDPDGSKKAAQREAKMEEAATSREAALIIGPRPPPADYRPPSVRSGPKRDDLADF